MTLRLNIGCCFSVSYLLLLELCNWLRLSFYTSIVVFIFRRIDACILFFSHFKCNLQHSWAFKRNHENHKGNEKRRSKQPLHGLSFFFTSSFPFHIDLISILNFVYILLDASFECAEQSIEIYMKWNTIASTRQTKLHFEHNFALRY